MPNWMASLLRWIAALAQRLWTATLTQREEIALGASIAAILGVLFGLLGWARKRWLKARRPRPGTEFPFEIVTRHEDLIDSSFFRTSHDPIPDRDIEYLPRVRDEIDQAFLANCRILIRGGAKTGKTREAIELLRRHWSPGTTVLRLRHGRWLSPPFVPPHHGDVPYRRLILFIDDLDHFCRLDYVPQSDEETEDILEHITTPFRERLQHTVEYFEGLADSPEEVGVIVTARSEPKHWNLLEYDSGRAPWNSMMLFELPPLSIDASRELIRKLASATTIDIPDSVEGELAEKNEGSFMTIIQAFRDWKLSGTHSITEDHTRDFTGRLTRLWEKRYLKLVDHNPAVAELYAAIDLLQHHGHITHRNMVLFTAARLHPTWWVRMAWTLHNLLWKGWAKLLTAVVLGWGRARRKFEDFSHEVYHNWETESYGALSWPLVVAIPRRLQATLKQLMDYEIPHSEEILKPYDGQVDGAFRRLGHSLDATASLLPRLVASANNEGATWGLMLFAKDLAKAGEHEAALRTLNETLRLPLSPLARYMIHFSSGDLNTQLARVNQATADFTEAISRAPRAAVGYAYHGRAHAHQSAERFDAAIDDFTQAIELQPDNWRHYCCRAKCYREAGQVQEALADTSKALELNPHNVEIQHERALALVKAECYGDALAILERAIQLKPQQAVSYHYRAHVYEEMKEYRRAMADFNKSLEMEPRLAGYHRCRSRLYALLHQHEQALADAQTAVELGPESVSNWLQRGRVHEGLERYEEAVSDYSKAIALQPERPSLWVSRGVLHRKTQCWEKAIADFEEAAKLQPHWNNIYIELAQTYIFMMREEDALTVLTKAIQANPDVALNWYNRAKLHRGMQRYSEAVADLNRAANLGFREEGVLHERGSTYRAMGEYDAAIDEFTRGIELESESTFFLYERAYTYRLMGRNEDALADLGILIGLEPDEAANWYRRGFILRSMGRHVQAQADLDRACDLRPGWAQAHHERGHTHEGLKRYQEAIADFSIAIEVEPDTAQHYFCRACCHTEMGCSEAALRDHSRAVELEPDEAKWWYHRGIANMHAGRYKAAVADFDRAERLGSEASSVYYRRGEVYRLMGSYDEALAALTQAIRLAPESYRIWDERALVHWSMGDCARALADLDRAVQLEPENAFLYQHRGALQRFAGKHGKALVDLTTAIQLNPGEARFWHERALIYRREESYEKALSDLSRAVELQPGDARTYRERGLVYREMEQHRDALASFSRAIDLEPEDASSLGNRGEIYRRLGSYELALADFNRALRMEPSRHECLYGRYVTGKLLGIADEADLAGAVEQIRRVYEKDPRCWPKALTLARYLAVRGDSKEAESLYRGALSLGASPHELRRALHDLRSLLDSFPDHEIAGAMRDLLLQHLKG